MRKIIFFEGQPEEDAHSISALNCQPKPAVVPPSFIPF